MNVRPLTPALAKKARDELNEDPNRINDDVQHIKDWIAKQPHLRARTDDQWLLGFLRGCKFSLEKTKEKIDMYYSVRAAAPELFAIKHTDPIFDVILNDGGVLALPKTMGPDSPRVTLTRIKRIDLSKYSFSDLVGVSDYFEKTFGLGEIEDEKGKICQSIYGRISTMFRIAFIDDDHLMIAGGIIVADCAGVSMSHFTQLTPTFLKKLSVIGQDASPLRMKGLHVVHPPPGLETIFNLMKSFFPEKYRQRFYMHSTLEDLYKYIPKDILPADYGGNGGTTEDIIAITRGKVKEYGTFLKEEENYGIDEYKRPGKPKTAEDMFGVDGSFRKLEVD